MSSQSSSSGFDSDDLQDAIENDIELSSNNDQNEEQSCQQSSNSVPHKDQSVDNDNENAVHQQEHSLQDSNENQQKQQDQQVQKSATQSSHKSLGEKDVQQEDDAGDEMLDLLCDQIEVDTDYKEKQKIEVNKMNGKMKEKLAALQASKQTKKVTQMEKHAHQAKEQFSGLLLRPKRLIQHDDLEMKVNKRKFVSVLDMDSPEERNQMNKAFFTVGVLVEKFPVRISKNNKKFCIFKISDLVKYDTIKVRKELEKTYQKDSECFKSAMKAYNNNGYKTISFMAFNEACSLISNLNHGTVVGILNPKFMKNQASQQNAGSTAVGPVRDYGFTFTVESDSAIAKIGYSEDYDVCRGQTRDRNSGLMYPCHVFLNKSTDKICNIHKLEAQEKHMTMIRSHRLGCMSERVDINAIKRKEKLMEFGAFQNKGQLRRDNRPKAQLLPEERAKLQVQQKKEQSQYASYVANRLKRTIQAPKADQGSLICTENKALMKKDNHMMADEESDEDGLEFDEPASNSMTGGAKTFRDFLGQKVSFQDKFGNQQTNTSVTEKRKKLS